MSQISEQRREQIVQTARRIVDEYGPGRLTAEAITQEVGVSRPLLYHYFANMGDLLNAVIDIYALEFEARLLSWEHDENVRLEAASDPTGWTVSFIGTLRTDLVDKCPLLRGTDPQEAPAAYPRFLGRCAGIVADHLLVAKEPALAPLLEAGNPRETVYLTVFGMMGLVRNFPETDNETVASIVDPLWIKRAAKKSPVKTEQDKAKEQVAEETGRKSFLDWIFN
mgnify:CR=1 FL=1